MTPPEVIEGSVIQTAGTIAVLPPDEDARFLSPIEQMLENARALVVADDQMATIANDELRAIKRKASELDEERREMTRPLDESKAKIIAKYKRPLDMLTQAEGYIKKAILDYTNEQRRKREEAEAKAREAARKEAERLAAQAAKAEAAGKIEKAEVLTQAASAAAVAAPVLPEPVKLDGMSTRKVYKARVKDKAKAVAALLANPMTAALVVIDEGGLNKIASTFKEAFNVDGCELVVEDVVVTRK